MKIAVIGLLAAFLMIVAVPAQAHRHSTHYQISTGHHSSIDGSELEISDDELIFTPADHDEDGEVRITEKHELYVNDKLIRLDSRQQEMVGEYYEQMMVLMESAKKIGLEGAKVGVQGAALGMKAVGSVFRLLSPDYDTDDLEREMEREAAKIEAKANRLEDAADEIEEQAEELEDLHYEMIDEIPELDDLGWF